MRIYLHASKTPIKMGELEFIIKNLEIPQLQEFRAINWQRYRGHIIGEITIVDEITAQDIGMKVSHSRWFFGIYGFVVKDGVLYDNPVPMRGQLGFFEVNRARADLPLARMPIIDDPIITEALRDVAN